MTRTMLAGLATVAVLATLTHTPAEAGKFKRSGGSNTNGSASASASSGNGSAAANAQRQRRLHGNQNQPTANTGASIHALGVYLQWREKCLNNLLPRCE